MATRVLYVEKRKGQNPDPYLREFDARIGRPPENPINHGRSREFENMARRFAWRGALP